MKRSSRAGRLTQLERNQRTTGIFFILPSLVLCAIFMVVPLINVIRYSLTDWDGLSKTYNFVGLYNYMHLHEIEGFGEMMLATVTFAIGVTAITIIVSFLAALALDKRGRDRLPRGLMRALWFFPALLSGAVVGILWRIMYNYNNGVINKIITSAGPAGRQLAGDARRYEYCHHHLRGLGPDRPLCGGLPGRPAVDPAGNV